MNQKTAETIYDELQKKIVDLLKIQNDIHELESKLKELSEKFKIKSENFMLQLPIPLSKFNGITSWDNIYNNKKDKICNLSECGPYGMDRSTIEYEDIVPVILRNRDQITLKLVKQSLEEERKNEVSKKIS